MTNCRNCGEPASGSHSLPVNGNAEFVPRSYSAGEWGAVPSCKECHDMHAAAGENAAAVLMAYEKATMTLLSKLEGARISLAKLYETAYAACRENQVDR